MTESLTYVAQTIDLNHPDGLTIHGSIEVPEDVDTTDKDASLLVKKRKADDAFSVPLEWGDDMSWCARIQLTDQVLSTGTWDYYIVSPDQERYRLKADETLNDETDQSLLFNHQDHTFHFGCYITVKGSLSFTLHTPTTTVEHVSGQLISSDAVIRLAGTLEASVAFDAKQLQDTVLVIKQESRNWTHNLCRLLPSIKLITVGVTHSMPISAIRAR